MFIEERYNDISYDMYDKTVIDKVNTRLDDIDRLIKNYFDLDYTEKYKLLNILYEFYFQYEDFLQILNLKYGNIYDKVMNLRLKLQTEYTYSEGHGRDFSWWTEIYKYKLICAVKPDFKGNEKKVYSSSQIKRLISEQLIYPFNLYMYKVDKPSKDYEEYKEYNQLPLFVDTLKAKIHNGAGNYLLDNVNPKYMKEIVEVIDNNIKPNQVFRDAKTNIRQLQDDLKYSYYTDGWLTYEEEDIQKINAKVRNYYNENFKNKYRMQ